MASEEYRKALALAETLSINEQLDLVEELIRILRETLTPEERCKIIEHNGVSKEFGKALDEIEQMVLQMRDEWEQSQAKEIADVNLSTEP